MNREALATHKKDLEELLPDMALHLPPTHAQKLRDLVDGLGDALANQETVQPVEPAGDDLGAPPLIVETIHAINGELARRAEADVQQAATLERIAVAVERIAESLTPATTAAQG